MRELRYKGFTASVDYDEDDAIFFGRIAEIRDGVGFHGETVGKLELAFHDAVDDYLAGARAAKASG